MAFLAAAAPMIGTIATVAGTGLSAANYLQQGAYGAQVARNNAETARRNADYARTAGMAQASIASMKGAEKLASLKADQAASGVDVNSGSFVDVQGGQREADALDAETVLTNAELSAYGYSTQARDFEAEAVQTETASWFDALGSLASGASSLAGKWGTGGDSKPKISGGGKGFAGVVGRGSGALSYG